VFLVTISLIYGVENNAVTSPDLLYGEMSPDASTEFGGMPGMDYAYHGDECFEAKEGLDNREIDKLTMQNKQAVAEIRRIEAPRNETLEDLLKEVS
jgi:hypothetical protein